MLSMPGIPITFELGLRRSNVTGSRRHCKAKDGRQMKVELPVAVQPDTGKLKASKPSNGQGNPLVAKKGPSRRGFQHQRGQHTGWSAQPRRPVPLHDNMRDGYPWKVNGQGSKVTWFTGNPLAPLKLFKRRGDFHYDVSLTLQKADRIDRWLSGGMDHQTSPPTFG